MTFRIVKSESSIEVYAFDGFLLIGNSTCSFIKENLLYFNRLYVNPFYRGKGYGTQLLVKMLQIVKDYDIPLQLDINPYGDMNYEQLEKFYSKHGFIKYKVDNNYSTYFFNKRE